MADAGWPADALEVGRIGDAWGLKGWFKVQSYASPPEAMGSMRPKTRSRTSVMVRRPPESVT